MPVPPPPSHLSAARQEDWRRLVEVEVSRWGSCDRCTMDQITGTLTVHQQFEELAHECVRRGHRIGRRLLARRAGGGRLVFHGTRATLAADIAAGGLRAPSRRDRQVYVSTIRREAVLYALQGAALDVVAGGEPSGIVVQAKVSGRAVRRDPEDLFGTAHTVPCGSTRVECIDVVDFPWLTNARAAAIADLVRRDREVADREDRPDHPLDHPQVPSAPGHRRPVRRRQRV